MSVNSQPPDCGTCAEQRPSEPEHPMLLDGAIIPGDTLLMLRCLLEEMLMAGVKGTELDRMSRNPFYQGLYAARQAAGEEIFAGILLEAVARRGSRTVRVQEAGGGQDGFGLSAAGEGVQNA